MYWAVTVKPAAPIDSVSSLSQPVCFQPSAASIPGFVMSASVFPASGFTQYLVTASAAIVPWSPALNSTNTKLSGTSGLSSPGCGTTSFTNVPITSMSLSTAVFLSTAGVHLLNVYPSAGVVFGAVTSANVLLAVFKT